MASLLWLAKKLAVVLVAEERRACVCRLVFPTYLSLLLVLDRQAERRSVQEMGLWEAWVRVHGRGRPRFLVSLREILRPVEEEMLQVIDISEATGTPGPERRALVS